MQGEDGAPGISTGSVTGLNITAVVGGYRLTGLLEVSSLDLPAQEAGGPLVTLTGQVLGMNLAAVPGVRDGAGYVIPVNGALRIAKQIAGQS